MGMHLMTLCVKSVLLNNVMSYAHSLHINESAFSPRWH
ncbi:hypothetical protein ALO95_102293 [Pseudomonas syringae pv. antirrhini]|uniref:Uncharacterized protein n=4 Tax=Pseudomonas syringae group TaxID=136849 RepID=A0A3M3RFB4_9PSED|nr:Unknown protein sequence [Pseudomonas syringae pv. maculicola]KPW45816.1 hypothetical protein ALO88_102708 [Pseudomonas syringae pv. antirrhini]RMN44414.1 hypothetical protein ALQ58_102467 [Pseudomonas syringae pv. apii]RMO86041.1 hypothetical protein ALQ32_102248 [Pseudomonas syringae pv. tagetis]RMR17184.1 hypothetical protein ALP89_102573 [Pseudomonas syringae pv. persicae]